MAVEGHAGHRALVRDGIDDDAQLWAAGLDGAAGAHGFGVELARLAQERAEAALGFDGEVARAARMPGHRSSGLGVRRRSWGGGGERVVIDDDFAGESAVCGIRDGGRASDCGQNRCG